MEILVVTLTEKRMTMPSTSHHVEVLKPTIQPVLLHKISPDPMKRRLLLSAFSVQLLGRLRNVSHPLSLCLWQGGDEGENNSLGVTKLLCQLSRADDD